ncbi:MAG: hypothetical protein Q4G62_10405 [Pseudomonadota bacterium]|nr:hypothetical protein [Pseudomonadota bacterium]
MRPLPRPKPVLAVLLPLMLAACASGGPLVTGKARTPIEPSAVRVYYGPPAVPFEEIAILDVASGNFTYGDRNKQLEVIERLRAQAASVGANGVIFQRAADGYGGSAVSIGAGGGRYGGRSHGGIGVGVSVSPRKKHGSGIAIHVPNPPAENSEP